MDLKQLSRLSRIIDPRNRIINRSCINSMALTISRDAGCR